MGVEIRTLLRKNHPLAPSRVFPAPTSLVGPGVRKLTLKEINPNSKVDGNNTIRNSGVIKLLMKCEGLDINSPPTLLHNLTAIEFQRIILCVFLVILNSTVLGRVRCGNKIRDIFQR